MMTGAGPNKYETDTADTSYPLLDILRCLAEFSSASKPNSPERRFILGSPGATSFAASRRAAKSKDLRLAGLAQASGRID
jgi:hypothetical protein